jgi:hypothetical protein
LVVGLGSGDFLTDLAAALLPAGFAGEAVLPAGFAGEAVLLAGFAGEAVLLAGLAGAAGGFFAGALPDCGAGVFPLLDIWKKAGWS